MPKSHDFMKPFVWQQNTWKNKIWFITVYHVLFNLGIDNAFSTWLDRCFSVAGTLTALPAKPNTVGGVGALVGAIIAGPRTGRFERPDEFRSRCRGKGEMGDL